MTPALQQHCSTHVVISVSIGHNFTRASSSRLPGFRHSSQVSGMLREEILGTIISGHWEFQLDELAFPVTTKACMGCAVTYTLDINADNASNNNKFTSTT
jgi:hypothetical protein